MNAVHGSIRRITFWDEVLAELQTAGGDEARDWTRGGGVHAEGFFDTRGDVVRFVRGTGDIAEVAGGEDAVAPFGVLVDFDEEVAEEDGGGVVSLGGLAVGWGSRGKRCLRQPSGGGGRL